MNLSCQGVTVLTAGELVELTQRMANVTSPALTAMSAGGEVTPTEAYACLDIELRLAAEGDDVVHDLLDRGLDRLERAFPQLNPRSSTP